MSSIEQTFIPYHAETRLGRGRMLVFAPHPDDEVLGCGGAILSHVAAGESVRVIIATDGAFGAADATAYAETRQMESRAAAAVLGYGEPEFWGLPDRGLHADEALAQGRFDVARYHCRKSYIRRLNFGVLWAAVCMHSITQ